MTSLMNDQIETLSNIKFSSIRSHTQTGITASKASTGSRFNDVDAHFRTLEKRVVDLERVLAACQVGALDSVSE